MVHLIASEYVSFFVFPSPTAVMFYYLLLYLHCKEISSLSERKQEQECKRLHLSLFRNG